MRHICSRLRFNVLRSHARAHTQSVRRGLCGVRHRCGARRVLGLQLGARWYVPLLCYVSFSSKYCVSSATASSRMLAFPRPKASDMSFCSLSPIPSQALPRRFALVHCHFVAFDCLMCHRQPSCGSPFPTSSPSPTSYPSSFPLSTCAVVVCSGHIQ